MQDNKDSKIIELEAIVDNFANSLAESLFYATQILSKIVETTERYYDGSHSRFVADKAALVATEMGMNEADVITIKIAAQLHDIGKVGMPETLLFKFQNEMSEKESNQYKQHPELGYNILAQHPNFSEIAEIILQHHERLDGSGFPKFLTKDSIHIGAKIIGVVNFYHNQIHTRQRAKGENFTGAVQYSSTSAFLTSTRERYNSAMNYLNRKAGVLYDKKIVSLFTGIIEAERREIGYRSILRLPINAIEPGMVFAEDYFTSFGMLIAAKGESTTKESIKALSKFFDSGDLPHRMLVMK